MDIKQFGWSKFFEDQLTNISDESLICGRIIKEHRERYIVITEFGQFNAELSGKMRFDLLSGGSYPAVGDWVQMVPFDNEKNGYIQHRLKRKSCMSRKVAGSETIEQAIAANIDTIFVVTGLDNEFNISRIERYLTLAFESETQPVILLNKADLCSDLKPYFAQLETLGNDLPIFALSAEKNQGLKQLQKYIKPWETVVFVGSSGVGKSTLINRLIGEDKQKTFDVRNDSKGRHTTTSREMITLPNGGIVIDTPGMREIQLWSDGTGLQKAFADIESLIENCRYNDCQHSTEPGCAVQEAITSGDLEEKRFTNYLKQKRELKKLALRKSGKDRHLERLRNKKFTKMVREKTKEKKKQRSNH